MNIRSYIFAKIDPSTREYIISDMTVDICNHLEVPCITSAYILWQVRLF